MKLFIALCLLHENICFLMLTGSALYQISAAPTIFDKMDFFATIRKSVSSRNKTKQYDKFHDVVVRGRMQHDTMQRHQAEQKNSAYFLNGSLLIKS